VEENQVHQDLASIRNLMERSSKFLSLSGLSGILAGIYALIGAAIAYRIIYINHSSDYAGGGLSIGGASGSTYGTVLSYEHLDTLAELFFVAVVVLVASVASGLILSMRKARKSGQKFWGASSKALVFNMVIPLLTGGALMLIFVLRGYYGIVAPASLIFYGLALIGAGNYTFKGVQYLGINEIILGLIAAMFPGYGLLFWAVGFGVLHIIYGSVMYIKYDR
jgi:hypothetical protein